MDRDQLAAMVAALGGARSANAAVVGAREGSGTTDQLQSLAGGDKRALALLDRFSHGGIARETLGKAGALLGLPAAAAYEGTKAVQQSPLRGVNPVGDLLLLLSGGPLNAKTSPASMENVEAYMAGILDDPPPVGAQAPADIRFASR